MHMGDKHLKFLITKILLKQNTVCIIIFLSNKIDKKAGCVKYVNLSFTFSGNFQSNASKFEKKI